MIELPQFLRRLPFLLYAFVPVFLLASRMSGTSLLGLAIRARWSLMRSLAGMRSLVLSSTSYIRRYTF